MQTDTCYHYHYHHYYYYYYYYFAFSGPCCWIITDLILPFTESITIVIVMIIPTKI